MKSMTIRQARNGWYVRENEPEEGYIAGEWVFEINDDWHGSDERIETLKTLKDLFYFLKDAWGIHYSKHEKHNMDISIEAYEEN